MKSNRIKALLVSVAMIASCGTSYAVTASAENETFDSTVTVNMSGATKEINPYIYGVNDGCALDKVTTTCVRQGGNRMTGYNWETNASNAGEDWQNSSDTHISSSSTPGMAAKLVSDKAAKYNIGYKFTTLQMAGYVAADTNGSVTADEKAPSSRWNEVLFRKDSDLSLTPDLTDGKVYMDEYVNYIIKTFGDSSTSTGMQGYSLDNEPALWNDTHPYLHPEEVTMEELVTKSKELASVVKELDPNADVFGPALWGYLAYKQLGDSDTSDEWEKIKAAGNYNWFIDYYLDEMKKASDEKGTRLLDYLDIHYYNQATKSEDDILQSPRTLWDGTFAENSWIGESWFAADRPFFKHIFNAIDTYYPGTKLAISEYNFGSGDTLAGAVAEVDGLGVFATNGVQMATLWDTANGSVYPYLGINLYTNYDGKGSDFGDTLLTDTSTTDYTKSTAYASIHSGEATTSSDKTVDVIITNKDTSKDENATIKLDGTSDQYKSGLVYGITKDSKEIVLLDKISESEIKNNEVTVNLPSVSAVHVVLNTNANAYGDVDVTEPTEPEKLETKEITDFTKTEKGIEFTVDNPNDIAKIELGISSSSASGSSYWGGGGGLCFTIDTADKKGQWASKAYSYTNKDSSIEVEFDGKFTVPISDTESEEMEGTISSGKIEIQNWWDYAEIKGDKISFDISKVTVYYKNKDTKPTETKPSETVTEPTETTVSPATETEATEPTETSEVPTAAPTETEPSETASEATTQSPTTDFDPTKVIFGDVNSDNNVTIADAVLLNKYLVNSATLSDLQLKAADALYDSKVDSTDTLAILKLIVGTYDSLPVNADGQYIEF
ncbi:MAG: glycoside hydrolase family 44 protein [Ruminococcus callidus]|nr:glycoside hydrolase family 44 protein [Ruminococcus callidus]